MKYWKDVLSESHRKTLPENNSPPIYEVEFIPTERRISDRCSPSQRLNKSTTTDERRTTSGRRDTDQNKRHPLL